MSKFNIEKIHDSIWVFKNAYKYGKEFIDYYENQPPFKNEAENWEAWYTFGDHRRILTPTVRWDQFPEKKDIEYKIFNEIENDAHKNYMVKEVLDIFYETTKQYLEEQNIVLPNWVHEPFDIASYNPGAGAGEDHGMSYHTDFQYEKKDEPGTKFAYTCLFYLNDDYDGGEIMFKELSEDLNDVLWRTEYKPSCGDVLIFPSNHPIYHATRKCKNSKKYLLRMYWRYEFEGSPEYWSEKEKYSDESSWQIYLADKRKKMGLARGQLINNNDTSINRNEYEQ